MNQVGANNVPTYSITDHLWRNYVLEDVFDRSCVLKGVRGHLYIQNGFVLTHFDW